jgi:two-component system, LytTR family, sensor kinase
VLRSQLAEAQLATLRMQLNPHFLFNTLHAVSALVDRDPAGVRRMIARLSELLRSTLEDGAAPERSVEEEVAFASRYLEIMQLRFEGKLEVAMEIDSEARDALVPTLILQPLVENAIKHGIAKTRGAGWVAVEVQRAGDYLRLAVRDSGPGVLTSSPIPSGGVGLRNTDERLRQMYGANARLTVGGSAGGGTVAQVELPYRVGEKRSALPATAARS